MAAPAGVGAATVTAHNTDSTPAVLSRAENARRGDGGDEGWGAWVFPWAMTLLRA